MKSYFKVSSPTILMVFIFILSGCSSRPLSNPWERTEAPSMGPAMAIGSYSAGCLRGGQSLFPSGRGYHVLHPSRRRYYGHPDLLSFIEKLSEQVYKRQLGTLLIGDLSRPRGGPMDGGHASHQTGLDVDIWFGTLPGLPGKKLDLSLDERERLPAPNMILTSAPEIQGEKLFDLNPLLWRPEIFNILRMAAEDPRVDRIFVHPSIKRVLCEKFRIENWVRKIRPWWGHEDHFHVRLLCPKDDLLCTSQDSKAAASSACDASLSWWFGPEALNKVPTPEEEKERQEKLKKVKELPELPAECQKELLAPADPVHWDATQAKLK